MVSLGRRGVLGASLMFWVAACGGRNTGDEEDLAGSPPGDVDSTLGSGGASVETNGAVGSTGPSGAAVGSGDGGASATSGPGGDGSGGDGAIFTATTSTGGIGGDGQGGAATSDGSGGSATNSGGGADTDTTSTTASAGAGGDAGATSVATTTGGGGDAGATNSATTTGGGSAAETTGSAGGTGGASSLTATTSGGGASSGGATSTDATSTDGSATEGGGGAPSEDDCSVTELVHLPIADRVDLVFDEKHCFVYISTESGVVQAYDIRNQTLEPLIDLGDRLVGIDLSPDQDTLIVANAASFADDEGSYNEVFAIDLPETRSRTLAFATESAESGTFMPLFIDNDTFLVSSSFAGSGWVPLREVDVASGSYATLADVRQDTMLALSGDGSTVAVAESNISSGPMNRYSLADQSFEGVETEWSLYEVAVNRDGTQFAVPLYAGLFIYTYSDSFDPEPHELGEYAEFYALGVVYSPDSDVLYVAWNGPGYSSSIEALDSVTFEPLFTLDSNPELEHTGNNAFVHGRLRVARSGNMLGATVPGGVRLYPARNAP